MIKIKTTFLIDFAIGYILYVVFIGILIKTSYGSSTNESNESNEFPAHAFNTNNMAPTSTNLVEVGKCPKETINELNGSSLSAYRLDSGKIHVRPMKKEIMKNINLMKTHEEETK